MTSSGQLFFNVYTKHLFITADSYVEPGQLHHLAIVWRAARDETVDPSPSDAVSLVRFYVDGHEVEAVMSSSKVEFVDAPFSALLLGGSLARESDKVRTRV